MASPKPQVSDSAASPEELSEVQVMDSCEPLVTVSSLVPSSARVMDSIEPLVPTVEVQVLDSSEPLVLHISSADEPVAGPSGTAVMALPSSCSSELNLTTEEPVAGPSGVAAMAIPGHAYSSELNLTTEEPVAGPSGVAAMAIPGHAYSSELNTSGEPVAGPSGVAGPRGMAKIVMPDLSSEEDVDEELVRPSCSGSSGRRKNPYSSELSSMWNWRKIFTRLGTAEQCIVFAEERGLLAKEKNCTYHKRKMSVTRVSGEVGKFRCFKSNCRSKSESRAKGTWFENCKIAFTYVFQLMYAFSEGLSYTQTRKELVNEDSPVLSTRTVADWFSYCRETIVIYELENEENREKIGGPGKIVQIDESKCGKRKYNRGRHIEGHWVIGMIEDGSDDLRLEVCPDNIRTAEALVPLIKKHVREGSIIHTDYWRAYMSLPEHGYVHKRVNHSDPSNRFVAPDGTHTQRIESQWRGLKKAFRQQQNKHNFTDWLCEYTWRRRIRIHHLDPFEELLKTVCHVYKINK